MPDKSLYTGYNSLNLGKAKQLRRDMTKQERHLWYDFLRTYPIRFYRQRPIDRYIADFYSSTARLVIELDGDQHAEAAAEEHDRVRTEALRRYGLEVLRFANSDVDRSFESVCQTIHRHVKERLRLLGREEALQKLAALDQTWDLD